MSDSESSFDEAAHEKLVTTINDLGTSKYGKKKLLLRQHVQKASESDLVAAIHSTRNTQGLKKALEKKKRQNGEGLSARIVQAPLHRLARERVESAVAYREIGKDLELWASVVQKNRLADQVSFPLEDEDAYVLSGTERKQTFKPRTPLEVEIANVLGVSKNNLGNEDMYTEAEKDLIRAMSLEEAKAKCAQLQRMRALISYKEAKLKRQAKIKSKAYHRHLKRQKRRKLIKEFDELLAKDPAAAKEKLAEIERQRILERATLKHRNGSKRAQMLARYATKDRAAKKALEEQIRLGRELVEKHGLDQDPESINEEDEILSTHQLIERAAEMAAKDDVIETSTGNPTLLYNLRLMRQKEKFENIKSAAKAVEILSDSVKGSTNLRPSSKLAKNREWDDDVNWNHIEESTLVSEVITTKNEDVADSANVVGNNNDKLGTSENTATVAKIIQKPQNPRSSGSKRNKKSKNNMEVLKNSDTVTIDTLFDKMEEAFFDSTVRVVKETRNMKDVSNSNNSDNGGLDEVQSGSAFGMNTVIDTGKSGQRGTDSNVLEENNRIDISIDPQHFLKAETHALTQVSADLIKKVDEFDAQIEQENLVAEAFKDDDVVASFENEKAATEEAEKPKDIDLTLAGWGSWAGPGISMKQKERFVIKAKEKKRRDQERYGVIISEMGDRSIEKVQPRSVPFPYTSVEDFEAVIRQPIGKDWNTPSAFHNLTKRAIVTKSGRIIRPLDKESALKKKAKEVANEENQLK